MIPRRRFLAASAAGALAAGAANAGPAWAGSRLPEGLANVVIEETFAPPEWMAAFQAATSVSGNAGDRAFLSRLQAKAADAAPYDGKVRLLSLAAPGLEPFSPDLARRLAPILNDRLSLQVAQSQGAAKGLACVSAFDPDAAREAERAVIQLGLHGIALGANRGMRLSHRALWPLYAFAQSAGAPIYLPAAFAPMAGDAPYVALRREGVIEGASADSAAHAGQLIFGGVLDAFPRLQVILGRLGEATPHWHGELTLARSTTPQSEASGRTVRDYFRTNIHLTAADMTSAETAQFCRLALGDGRVLPTRG